MKKYYLIILLPLFISCGVFSHKQENYQKLKPENVSILNGDFSLFPFKGSDEEYPFHHYANEKFYRKYGRVWDTIKFNPGANFKISILSDKKINFNFINSDQVVRNQTFKYKIKDDGFLYIKNRNTIIKGIPFLFGGVDVRKVRITLTESNELIINDVYSGAGAYLLIFGDAKSWESSNKYKRI